MTELAIAVGPSLLNPIETVISPADYLKAAAERLPDGQLITLSPSVNSVTTGPKATQTASYAQLWQQAACLLSGLRSQGLTPGQNIILLFEGAQDLVPALWSCFMGGFVPLPMCFSGETSQTPQALLKIKTATKRLGNPVILTTDEMARMLQAETEAFESVTIVLIDSLRLSKPDYRLHTPQPEDLAVLFLSSGTTGHPKLVAFSAESIVRRFYGRGPIDLTKEEIFALYWLPLDHASAVLRIANPDIPRKVFLPTETFLKNPLSWLSAVEDYDITQTSITNFGMTLVTKAVTERHAADKARGLEPQHWNLTSLNNVGIGAELIVPVTYQKFIQTLEPFGLNSEMICTGYGLTECGTVSGGRSPQIIEQGGNTFLTLGSPNAGYAVRIIDEQSQVLPENTPGRVQIKGPVTTRGYHQRPEATRSLFVDGGWMETGDLGFMHNNHLAITGRAKDIIIINAQNFSYQHIEQIVEKIPSVEPSFTIACAIRNDHNVTDELAIFFHPVSSAKDTLISVSNAITRSLAEELGVTPRYIVPIDKSEIPRTAAGKIRRMALVEQLNAGHFSQQLQQLSQLSQAVRQSNFVGPSTPTEKMLCDLWGNALNQDSVSLHDNFFELGGQSLLAAQIAAELEQAKGIALPLAAFLQAPTIQEMAQLIDTQAWLPLWQPLVPIQPDGSRPILFCIHGGGSNVLVFKPLSVGLGNDQPLYGLQSRSLSLDQSAPQSFETIAADYIHTIKTVQPQGPYFLVGLSYGGKIAFEMTRQLEHQGETVSLLGLIDTHGASSMTVLPPMHRLLSIIVYFFRYALFRFIARKLAQGKARLKTLILSEKSAFQPSVNAQQRQHSEIPVAPVAQASPQSPEAQSSEAQVTEPQSSNAQSSVSNGRNSFFNKQLKQFHLTVLKNSPWRFLLEQATFYNEGGPTDAPPTQRLDDAVLQTSFSYRPSESVRHITLFLAQEKPPGLSIDPFLGWGNLSKEKIDTYNIPGHHNSIARSPVLARKVKGCITKATSVSPE